MPKPMLDWVVIYRTITVGVLGICGTLCGLVYTNMQNGTSAAAETAAKAVQVADAAKTSIATVTADVAALKARADDSAGVISLIEQEVSRSIDIQGQQTNQLSAINTKLDMLAGEKVGER